MIEMVDPSDTRQDLPIYWYILMFVWPAHHALQFNCYE
jgi:hypothetical protein